jgi:cobalamin biosynthesis Mg chelatase CobN
LVRESRVAETLPPPKVADEVSATERDTKPYPVAEPAHEDVLSRYRDDSSVRASIAKLRTLVKDEQFEQRSREPLESSARPRTVPGLSAPEAEPARPPVARAQAPKQAVVREPGMASVPRSVRASPMALVVWLVVLALVLAAALWWFVL